MSLNSRIEWTDATWNPVTGCSKVSPGCKFCYAETFAERFRGIKNHPFEQGFDLRLWPDRLELPLRWRKPKRIFVNSMSDLFHERIPDEFISAIFNVMSLANHHVFQVLTKRSERMKDWTSKHFGLSDESLSRSTILPENVWLGVSVENQDYAWRIEDLKKTSATTRFLSIEPLLGRVRLTKRLLKGIHWVIVGGESGAHGRRMDPDWVTEIHKACRDQNVPFFFKQWGTIDEYGDRVGKKLAGRLYRGRTWDEMPRRLSPSDYSKGIGTSCSELGSPRAKTL